MEHRYDVAIVGGGIAGYSAALSAKSLRLDYLWLGDRVFGGKVLKSEYVRNYPAFQGDGRQFWDALEAQRKREEIRFTQGRADKIFRLKEGYAISAVPQLYEARAVILCTGAEQGGGLAGESEFLGRGVSYCAVCDGALYRGKRIAAVLGSPAHAEEAEYLASFAETVYVFCGFQHAFRSPNILAQAGAPRRIEGGARAERIVTDGGALDIDGVFILRDSVPPASLIGGLETDGAHIAVKRDQSTNLAGVFAAGDATGLPYQYAKAAGEGLVAAHAAKRYLKSEEKERGSV